MAPSPVHPLIVSVLLHASYDCVASSDVLVWRIWACRLRHWEASSFETDDPGSDLCQGPEVGALTATLMSAAWVVATAFSFLALSWFTSLMHSHGRRPLLLVCSMVPLVATTCYALSVVVGRSSGLVLLLLSVVLSPLNSEVLIDLALRTYIADVTTGDRRAKWFGLSKGFNLAMSSVGLVVGGSAGTRSGHILAPYGLAVMLAVFASLYSLLILPESHVVYPHISALSAPSSPASARRSLEPHPPTDGPGEVEVPEQPVRQGLIFILRPLLALLPLNHLPLRSTSKSPKHRPNLIPLLIGAGFFLAQIGGSAFIAQLLLLKTTGAPTTVPIPPSPSLSRDSQRIRWTAEDAGVFLAALQGGRAGFLILVYPALRAGLVALSARLRSRPPTPDAAPELVAGTGDAHETSPLLAGPRPSSDGATAATEVKQGLDLALLLVAILAACASFLTWALARTSLALYLSLIFCIPVAMHEPSLFAYATANVQDEKQDEVIAGMTMVGALGSTLSAPVLGAIYAATPSFEDCAFLVASAIELLAALVSVFAR